MPLWVSDFLSSPAVMAMTNAQIGSYLLLLMAQWSSADDRIPQRHVRSIARWRGPLEPLREVLSLFQSEDGALFHSKLRRIRAEREVFSESRAEAGSKGGRAKAQSQPQSQPSSSSATASYAGAGEGEPPSTELEGEEPTPAIERAEDVPIPPELDTPEFREAWFEKWLPWRRARHGRNKPVSVEAAQQQLRKLAQVGVGQACMAIGASIANDWQGLFPQPPKNGSGNLKPRFAGSNVDPATAAALEAERRGGRS